MIKYRGKKNIEKEVDSVISYIRDLISKEEVLPGERLPAERKISEEVGVSRAKVRLALERLESYGVVRILPQSGSVLNDHSQTALIKQISSILDRQSYDFSSLVAVRTLLEVESVRLCAINRTDQDIADLKLALQEFSDNLYTPLRDEKDFAFHSAIAKACHNPVIYSLLLMITPDVLEYYRKLNACAIPPEGVMAEHNRILDCIIAKDPDASERELRKHFTDITEFAANHSGIVLRTRL